MLTGIMLSRLRRLNCERCLMTRVFPATRLETWERRYDPETGGMTESESAGGFFVIDQDAEEFIESTLGERFGIGSFFLMNLTREPETWAAVFFSEIIRDSDALLEARAELRPELGFAVYGDSQPGMKNPPLGAMVVTSADALRAASTRHEVFRKAWEALKLCSPDRKWVAVVDPYVD